MLYRSCLSSPPSAGSSLPSLHVRQKEDLSGCFSPVDLILFPAACTVLFFSTEAGSPHTQVWLDDSEWWDVHAQTLTCTQWDEKTDADPRTEKTLSAVRVRSKETLMWCAVAVRVSADAVIKGSAEGMPQDIRSKEKEVDPVSHFNKNPSVVTLKKRPNLEENAISERSGTAQSSHHPYSPFPNKPLPFSRYHKRTSTCSVAANPFPTLLCSPAGLYCSLLLSEHLPTNKKRAKSTATVERGEQHTGGQESRFTTVSSAALFF